MTEKRFPGFTPGLAQRLWQELADEERVSISAGGWPILTERMLARLPVLREEIREAKKTAKR